MLVISIIVLSVIIILIIEKIIINNSVKLIPLRIHVNGTRGKSSVVEYIYFVLQSNQKNNFAKITGVIPTLYKPDGSYEIIKRNSSARVQEQFQIIKKVSKFKISGFVMECMSITPYLQKLESKIFKPHFYIITNIRDDHKEVMGKSMEEQAISICDAIPKNSTVLTVSSDYSKLIESYSLKQSSKFILADEIKDEYKSKLPFGIFSDNVSIALKIADLLNINVDNALRNIIDEVNKKESIHKKIKMNNKTIYFINGFSVNDITSAENFINLWKDKLKTYDEIIILLNTRKDRPYRTVEFIQWITEKQEVRKILITGNHTQKAIRELKKRKYDLNKVSILKKNELNNFEKYLKGIINKDTLLIGIGNIAGFGFEILDKINLLSKKYDT